MQSFLPISFFFSFTAYSSDINTYIEGCLVFLENEGWDPGIQRETLMAIVYNTLVPLLYGSMNKDWEELWEHYDPFDW